MKTRTILTVVGFAALSAVSFAQSANIAALQGKTIPSFTMKTTDGKTMTDRSLRGKVVLLDFWATWCGPCKAAMPMLTRLHNQFSRQGLVVIGANLSEYSNPVKGPTEFAKKAKLPYPVTLQNEAFGRKIGVRNLPTMVLVDRKGVVQFVEVGFSPTKEKELQERIKKLLG